MRLEELIFVGGVAVWQGEPKTNGNGEVVCTEFFGPDGWKQISEYVIRAGQVGGVHIHPTKRQAGWDASKDPEICARLGHRFVLVTWELGGTVLHNREYDARVKPVWLVIQAGICHAILALGDGFQIEPRVTRFNQSRPGTNKVEMPAEVRAIFDGYQAKIQKTNSFVNGYGSHPEIHVDPVCLASMHQSIP